MNNLTSDDYTFLAPKSDKEVITATLCTSVGASAGEIIGGLFGASTQGSMIGAVCGFAYSILSEKVTTPSLSPIVSPELFKPKKYEVATESSVHNEESAEVRTPSTTPEVSSKSSNQSLSTPSDQSVSDEDDGVLVEFDLKENEVEGYTYL